MRYLIALVLLVASSAQAVIVCDIPYCGASGGCTTGATWAQCKEWPAEGHDYHGLAGGYDMSVDEGQAYMMNYCASWGGTLKQASSCAGIPNADIHDCGWANRAEMQKAHAEYLRSK
jgi:hypothetical protein